MRRLALVELSVVALTIVLKSESAGVSQPEAEYSIPLRLEISMDQPTCVIHENFPITLRIVNPNDFPVNVPGFAMGYVEPAIELILEGGRTANLRSKRGDSAYRGTPLTIPPNGELTRSRFVFDDNVGCLWWPDESGVFSIQARFTLGDVPVEQRVHPAGAVHWERPIARVRVEPGGSSDRRAWDLLEHQLITYEESLRNSTTDAESSDIRKIRLYGEFLERFGDSTYAAAIRWETGRLLERVVGNRGFMENEIEPMVDLLEECVTYCLDRGGAFAEEFLVWEPSRGDNPLIEIAAQHRRWALFKRMIQELDAKYPDDEAAIRYRKVLLSAAFDSMEVLEQEIAKYQARYPEGIYLRNPNGIVRSFARFRGLPEPE